MRVPVLISVCLISATLTGVGFAEPVPGDVFREFTNAIRFSEVDSASKRPNLKERVSRAQTPRYLEIGPLEKARKAEVVVEYWGGHIGTSGQAFRINGSDWIDIPQPQGTPGKPQCYYRTLRRATIEVPLSAIKEGLNTFTFKAGPQACYAFDWGFYWIYAFTVRLYYDESVLHPKGSIISHSDGSSVGDHPRFAVSAESSHSMIHQVDIIGMYDDFNWEGDGRFRQWHYIYDRGRIGRHIGTALRAPWVVEWDTDWISDQAEPVEIAARITDTEGITTITPSVKLRLHRPDRSVKMYRSSDFAENFGVRVGRRLEAKIPVSDSLERIRNARLVLPTWSAAHAEEIGINTEKLASHVGSVHNYGFDSLPVPARSLKTGDNVFFIASTTREHAAELNWPGPVLFVEFVKPAPVAASQWRFPGATKRAAIGLGREHATTVPVPVSVPFETGRDVIGVVDAVSGSEIPFQVEQNELVLLLPAGTRPTLHVYWADGAPRSPAATRVKVEDNVEWQGQKSFRITTPSGTWVYHKEGAGFASLLDAEGRDWISYRPEGGSAGNFRGIPNLGNDFGHPGHKGAAGATSRIVAKGPVRVRILSEKADKSWSAMWDIYPHFAQLTMLKAAAPFWFLYEGTPAGRFSPAEDSLTLSTGYHAPLTEAWSGDGRGSRWAVFQSAASASMLFLAMRDGEHVPDQYWPMQGNMTVFGFGRQYTCCGHYLTKTPATLSVGFLPKSPTEPARLALEDLMSSPAVRLGPVEARTN